MMKILLLNPRIDAEHQISQALEAKGYAVLFPDDFKEAWQMLELHGTSVDLAILHLEGMTGQSEPTLNFIKKIKADPSQADLPILLTTDKWTDEQCAAHQATAEGANAYLRWPFQVEQLVEVIEAVVSKEAGEQSGGPPAVELASALELADSSGGGEPQLELSPAPESSIESSLQLASESAPESPPPAPEGSSPLELSSSLPLEPPPAPDASFPAMEAPAPTMETPTADINIEADADSQDIKDEMPYLFKSGSKLPSASISSSLGMFVEPVGDAVVPGGAAHAPDIETFKKYLMLREQDVAVLSNQLKASREQVAALEQSLREEKARSAELTHIVNEQKAKIDDFDRAKAAVADAFEREINDLKFEAKSKSDKARVLEIQARDASEEMEKLKERVRLDIRKIRVREKELENRLEIMKKDSEALMSSRESKIIELKRKLDLLEFNMDLLQDQFSREKEVSQQLRERLAKVAQAVRVAGGLLDPGKAGAGAGTVPRDEIEMSSAGVSSADEQKAS